MLYKKLLFILFFHVFSFFTKAQKNYTVNYIIVDSVEKNNLLQSQFTTQITCANYLAKLIPDLQSKGFVTASIDSIKYEKNYATVQLYFGKKYSFVNILTDPNDLILLQKIGWKNETINFDKWKHLQDKILFYCQENGYPYAKIKLDSISINEDKINANLIIDKNFLNKIDSIRLYGGAKINNGFLQKYLSITNNSIYKKSLIDAIPKKINQLSYLEQEYPFNITMLPTSSVINLYLKPRKSSIVNVLLGLIPAPNPNGITNAPSGKLFLSGDAKILLNNALSMGETIGLNYQTLSINSRRINLLYNHPYIFKSNYGIETAFEIYKRDSSYVNLEFNAGIIYSLGENKSGKLFFQYQKTNTYPDTNFVKYYKKLPNIVDIKLYNIGFNYLQNNTDNKLNPTKGNDFNFIVAFGTKKIFKSLSITSLKDNNFNYESLYDSVKLNSYQFKLNANIAHFIPFKKQSTIKLALQSGLLLSQNYFRNELFQIGGFKILRGFDEESQFCNKYAIATTEYRYFIGGGSYFYVFSDGGFTVNPLVNNIVHKYISAGFGLSLKTKAGLFNLAIANGKREDDLFNFKQTKLHFGFVSIF